MEYWHYDKRGHLSDVAYAQPADEKLATPRDRLRVLILGGAADSHFHGILAANIQQWGYEAVLLPCYSEHDLQARQNVEGDVLLYDMDAPSQFVPVLEGSRSEITSYAGKDAVFAGQEYPQVRLLIALSSRSVSRLVLEQMGAITLLRKPFDMRYLERYLRVFQKLFYAEVERPGESGSDLQVLSGRVRRLLAGEGEINEDAPEQRKRILVADDRQEMTGAIRQCLTEQTNQRQHYEVREVHDGLALLEQCLSWKPHCVVTDLLMPWLNGYQAMRCLAARPSQTAPAFVVISALTQHEIPENRSYLQDKAVLYIDKPFEVENLLALIEQVLA